MRGTSGFSTIDEVLDRNEDVLKLLKRGERVKYISYGKKTSKIKGKIISRFIFILLVTYITLIDKIKVTYDSGVEATPKKFIYIGMGIIFITFLMILRQFYLLKNKIEENFVMTNIRIIITTGENNTMSLPYERIDKASYKKGKVSLTTKDDNDLLKIVWPTSFSLNKKNLKTIEKYINNKKFNV